MDGTFSESMCLRLLDSYPESNLAGWYGIGDGVYIGHSFSNVNESPLLKCKFYLKTSTGYEPTGSLCAKIYAHTDTYGSTGIPTGTALATSTVIDASTITDTPQLVEFTFGFGNNVVLSAATKYVIVLNYECVGGAEDYIQVGYDEGTTTHGGNVCTSADGSTWSYDAAKDLLFYVYGYIAIQTVLDEMEARIAALE